MNGKFQRARPKGDGFVATQVVFLLLPPPERDMTWGMSQAVGVDFGNTAKRSPETGLNRTRFPLWQKAMLFGAAYFALAEASTFLSAKGSPDMSFWLPGGLYVAVLLLNDYKSWPWLVVSASAANAIFDAVLGTPALGILVFILANTVTAVFGAWLVRTFVASRPTMATLPELLGLQFFSGVLSTLLGACLSAAGQVPLGMSQSFSRTCWIWWGSTSMTTLVVAPVVLAWSEGSPTWSAVIGQPKKMLEAAALIAGLVATMWWILVLDGGVNSPNKAPLILFLIWAGLRFGVRGATGVNLLFALLGGVLVEHYLKGVTAAEVASRDYALTFHAMVAAAATLGLVPAIVLDEHKRTLEKLRKSEERLQLAVQGSTDAIWDWNILTNSVFYSDRYRELLGYSQTEFPDIFASFESVLHPDDTDRVLKQIERHLRQHTPHDIEFRQRTKAGNYRWFRGRGQAIWSAEGQPVRMAGSITDVTSDKLSGQLLRQSEEKFSKAFRSSPNGIAISEMENARYIEVNDTFCQLMERPRDQILGRTSVELGVFDSLADRERVVGAVRSGGHIKDYEMRMRTRNGEIKALLVNGEGIEISGKPCVLLVITDITARLRAEDRLEKTSQQLRALSSRLQSLREEERTHLAREIHDHLGQLLTALNLDLRLIERRAETVADGELRAALQSKISSARQLAGETIASVQKIATELRPAILDRLGLEAAIEVEAQAFQARTGVGCDWTLPSNPVALQADQATAIFRIFQEILTNVARHAQAANVAVCLTHGDGLLQLVVDDDGIGIQPDDIANPTSLGLLGMRERVAIMGGTITFAAGGQRGTRVEMQIPLNGKVAALA
jgi:PAS domain S-box-containing protein